MLAKFILLLALGIVVYLIVSRMRREGTPRQAPRPPAQPKAAEDMVRCSLCGVHLPRSESFTSRGEFFCTDEHRKVGARKE